jgi:uncharacterized protein YccT (UPF0319 family)
MKAVYFTAKLVLLVSALFLVACSTGQVVKTYEGEALGVEQQAILMAPENIVVLSINGKKMKNYLLSDLNTSYGLKPGKNLVVFRSESVWAKAIREERDAPRSERIVSEPKEIMLNVKAGDKLSFKFERGRNAREARVLAEGFKADVIDSKFNIVATSVESGTFKTLRGENNNESSKLMAETSALQTLDALKVLWSAATAEEQKSFLSWAFQK